MCVVVCVVGWLVVCVLGCVFVVGLVCFDLSWFALLCVAVR